ncbi:MAG TPA: sodium:calcium antiporter [Desulfitobacterium dehalogenans]|uniref:Sodium:calcium antiporter n=1 Tax=Desulfitobacterium dehalogenans TaxID=36854 RepID=A0A7C6Z5Q3_9FIRM|nr:sodium:calcium antiporter [Desulfitobacterium dehalogenans]
MVIPKAYVRSGSLLSDLVMLLIGLGIILMSAEVFTNGVEWLGKRLHLGAGAVGSVLAAVGTALPETMVPIIAFWGMGGGDTAEVGIGAILGAPFMLITLAFFISGAAVLIFRRNNKPLFINTAVIKRDLSFFLLVYSLAIFASFLPTRELKLAVAALLPLLYISYVIKTVRNSLGTEDHDHLAPLYFAQRKTNPSLFIILTQLMFALSGMVAGAHAFVDAVQSVAQATGIPALVLSLIITPVATELPEKFNSVIWLKRGKDTLALGNITGAMVFQSSTIPALGIALTTWQLEPLALWSAILALGSGLFIYITLRRRGTLCPLHLMMGGGFYLLFIITLLRFPLH